MNHKKRLQALESIRPARLPELPAHILERIEARIEPTFVSSNGYQLPARIRLMRFRDSDGIRVLDLDVYRQLDYMLADNDAVLTENELSALEDEIERLQAS